jgi:hypothetical protein
MTPEIAEDAVVCDPAYAFKPSLMGATAEFVLRPDALEWSLGRRNGHIRYKHIGAVRLSYRPVSIQSHRFITEIWADGNPKIQIVSVSWRSVMEQQRLDAAYYEFITELHRRIAAAGGPARFSTGLRAPIYWIGVAASAAVIVATGTLAMRATGSGQWAAAAVVAIFFAVFAYQLGTYFYRNRPGSYRPDAIPRSVLPRV